MDHQGQSIAPYDPLHSHHDDAGTTRRYTYAPPLHSHSDINALGEGMALLQRRGRDDNSAGVKVKEEDERTSKTSLRSDDSFSAYIEHPVRQSTPPLSNHVHAARETLEEVLMRNRSRESTQRRDSVHSNSSDEADEDYGNASWPTTVDNEVEHQCDDKSSVPHGSIVIPDMEVVNEEDDADIGAGGEKKRRRRTNKAEANVLASVFSQTQFPDANTRDDLARRLNMKPKAVSIWFQNRRQAMKKRASRFGGVEGVNGPTVTAATMQVLGVGLKSTSPHCDARDLSSERLKRWMSLDDVAMMDRTEIVQADTAKFNIPTMPCADVVESNLSNAPILDFICKQRGQHQLSRMASMPSLASLISAKQDTTKQKDLRDLLPSNDCVIAPSLQRRSSASSLLAQRIEEQPIAKQILRERCFSLQTNNDGRAAVGDPLHPLSALDIITRRDDYPVLMSKMLQRKGKTELDQMESIWQRMQSSSTSSEDYSGSSDKENRDPAEMARRDNGEEDEERTLRLIAGKRAAKELAKKEKMLSEEGRRYVEEADARIALQQRKRSSLSSINPPAKLDMTSRGGHHKWNRAVSDAQVMRRSIIALTRVPSLDLTAGRDRSKDDGRPPFRSVSEMRIAKRPHPSDMYYDENRQPNSTLQARLSLQQKKRSRHSHSTSMELHTQAKALHPRTPFGSRRPDETLLRRYASTNSLPTPALSLLSSRLGQTGSFPIIPGSGRESSARLDGAQIVSSSQESSENGSDDWVEAWAQDKTSGSINAVNVLQDRSNILNSNVKSKLPAARHDDSGFFGSESGGEFDEDVHHGAMGGRVSKRRLVSQASSSPSKRGGDDRDRLAAETLLGLGSRS